MEMYKANDNRYADMFYRCCGQDEVVLPAVSLGLWHNLGSVDVFGNFIQIAHAAFYNLTGNLKINLPVIGTL